MKYLNVVALLTMLFLFVNIFPAQAQTDKELLEELMEEEQDAVNALVLYPEDVRQDIFVSTLHPEALIKMESIQTRTSAAFREVMESLPQSSQETLWDLTRYPGLIHQLALQRTGSEKSIEAVLADYPEVIHRRARDANSDRDLPLVTIDELNHSAESAFNSILNEYPPEVQQSLRALTELPEVLTILTENIRLTLLVGHVYEKDPDWVLHMADSLNLEVARQNAQEIEDWKTSLENDPEAMEELNASVKTYNEEYGYDDSYYDYDREDFYEESRDEVIVRYHYYYHYPYWFSYPYWYQYPHWRYYPNWYDWGFYYYPDRPVFIVGLPSFHFTYWFFDHGHHHRHYPHLSAHFVKHYHGHRRAGSSITTSVNNWHHRNRDIVSDNWLKDDGRLPKRFKEYGEFESSREKYNNEHPKQIISRKDYVTRNEKKYPTLATSTKEQKIKTEARKKTSYKEPVKSRIDKPAKVQKQKTIDPAKPKVDKPSKVKKQKTIDPVKPKVDKPTKVKKQKTIDPVKPKVDKPTKVKKQKTIDPVKPKVDKPTKVKKQRTVNPKISKKKKDKPTRKPDNISKQAPKVNKGQDYHKNTWEKSKTKKTNTRTTTQPKVKPKTKTIPRKSTPKKTKQKKSGGGE